MVDLYAWVSDVTGVSSKCNNYIGLNSIIGTGFCGILILIIRNPQNSNLGPYIYRRAKPCRV